MALSIEGVGLTSQQDTAYRNAIGMLESWFNWARPDITSTVYWKGELHKFLMRETVIDPSLRVCSVASNCGKPNTVIFKIPLKANNGKNLYIISSLSGLYLGDAEVSRWSFQEGLTPVEDTEVVSFVSSYLRLLASHDLLGTPLKSN